MDKTKENNDIQTLKNKSKRLEKAKGITLIALVITIIVLLILAGVGIATLTGKNGILSKTSRARTVAVESGAVEKVQVEAMGSYGINGNLDIDKLNKNLKNIEGLTYNGSALSDSNKILNLPAKVVVDGYEVQISGDGNVIKYEPILATDETKPYYPDGYERKQGTDLNTGLVMADGTNSFVWIEVPKSITASATNDSEIETALQGYAIDYRRSGYADEWYDGSGKTASTSTNLEDKTGCGLTSTEYANLKSKMLNSIKNNGGFWIGQYEMGTETARFSNTDALTTPVCKEGAYPYNYITCSQAQERASLLSTGKYTSSLMFGIQWDLVCKFIETKATNPGTSASDIKAAIKSNSTDWGNYSNATFDIARGKYTTSPTTVGSWKNYNVKTDGYVENNVKIVNSKVLLTTGATERNSLMNIYDFAGNVNEWTLEKSSSSDNPCAYRGGVYNIRGSGFTAFICNPFSTSYAKEYCGARLALY